MFRGSKFPFFHTTTYSVEEKPKILSDRKIFSETDSLFSENVAFTKFLQKKRMRGNLRDFYIVTSDRIKPLVIFSQYTKFQQTRIKRMNHGFYFS